MRQQEILSLHAELDYLNRQLVMANAHNADLQHRDMQWAAALHGAHESNNILHHKTQQVLAEAEHHKNQIRLEMGETLRASQEQIEILKIERTGLAALQRSRNVERKQREAAFRADLREHIRTLQQVKEKLEAQVNVAHEERLKAEAAKVEIGQVRDEKNGLLSKLELANDHQVAEQTKHRAEIAVREAELKQVKAGLVKTNTRLNEQGKEKKRIENQLKLLEAENIGLRDKGNENEKLSLEVTQLKKKLSAVNDGLAGLKIEVETKDKKVSDLSNEVGVLNKKLCDQSTELENKEAQIGAAKKHIKKLTATNSSLALAKSGVELLAQENAAELEKLKAKKKEDKQSAQAVAAATAAAEKGMEENARLKAEIAQLSEERDDAIRRAKISHQQQGIYQKQMVMMSQSGGTAAWADDEISASLPRASGSGATDTAQAGDRAGPPGPAGTILGSIKRNFFG